MLQVTNGVVTLTVTKGAFKSFYEHNGFHAVDGEDGYEEAGEVLTHLTPETGHLDHSSQQELRQDIDAPEDEDGDDEDDDFVELQCPECGETIYFDEDMLESGEELLCPNCNALLVPTLEEADDGEE